MKIFQSEQIREIDVYTIKNEPVSSIDLMERAALELYKWFTGKFDRSRRVKIFTGPGNNGGDGLALARLLANNRYEPHVYYVDFTESTSADWNENRDRLEKVASVPFTSFTSADQFPAIFPGDVIIDAIFGSGLNRPAKGLPADIINLINLSDAEVVSIDIPSGLFCGDNSSNIKENIVRADYTLSFQFPKLSFFFAENEEFTGEWHILPIGLSNTAIEKISTPFSYLLKEDISPFIRKRKKFDHKGAFGHGLMIAGSYGKMGAAILGAKAALRTGIGLLTCHIPSGGNTIMQTAVPEAITDADSHEKSISYKPDTESYNAIGIGPGMGTSIESGEVLHQLLKTCRKPMVIDADALNILSLNPKWYMLLNENIILTPHPKEFDRLTKPAETGYKRLQNQIKFSVDYNCYIVLKGAYTSVTTPEGKAYFNSTGNPGMASGGSGDVLTGIVLSLLAQGYSPERAALAAVFLHGMAGDIAAEKSGFESLISTDLVNHLGEAFRRIKT